MSKTHQCPKCSAPVPAGSRFCQTCGAGVSPTGASARQNAGFQWKLFAGVALVVVLLVAGTMMAIGQSGSKAPAAAAPGGSIAGAGPIPQWLATADPSIIADYAWAAEHYEELKDMPCYCGCSSVGHTSNAACYFQWEKDGTIKGYDAHALGWGICVDITRDVRAGLAKGKTLTQIRNEVDKKYQAEGLKPTNTPMPAAGK